MHTPEPWAKDGTSVIDNNNYEIFTCDGLVTSYEEDIDNARRIVACVNALEGFDTLLLEKISLKPYQVEERERVCAYVEDIEAQRDELLAALKSILLHPESLAAITRAASAIAKCEKP